MSASQQPDLTGTPADVYERILVPHLFLPWARDLVDLVAPAPGERALDIACGTGAVARLIAERVGRDGGVVGLDLNDGMLAVARKITAAPNIEWRGGSALELPFADTMFDVVVCQQGLQFFPDRPLALREMRRVLRSGSRLAVACWRDSSHNPAYAAIEHALAVHVGAEHSKLPPFGLGDAGELRRLLDGAGFHEIEVRAESKTVHWPSVDLFVRASVAAAPTMLGSLAEQGDAVLGDIIARVETEVQSFREADGSIRVPVGNHIASARS